MDVAVSASFLVVRMSPLVVVWNFCWMLRLCFRNCCFLVSLGWYNILGMHAVFLFFVWDVTFLKLIVSFVLLRVLIVGALVCCFEKEDQLEWMGSKNSLDVSIPLFSFGAFVCLDVMETEDALFCVVTETDALLGSELVSFSCSEPLSCVSRASRNTSTRSLLSSSFREGKDVDGPTAVVGVVSVKGEGDDSSTGSKKSCDVSISPLSSSFSVANEDAVELVEMEDAGGDTTCRVFILITIVFSNVSGFLAKRR